jgi:hypothetical protein
VSTSRRTWTIAQLLGLALLTACAKPHDPNALPTCDAPEVQELARDAATQAVKIPFTLSSFTEVPAESTPARRQCRVRAKHAASGASIWMRFTLARRPVKKKDKAEPPQQELAVVFAPVE